MRKAEQGSRSLAAIAEILAAEGFGDYAANEVKRYWRRRVVSPRQLKRLDAIKAAFGKMVSEKLDEQDRIVMGKYMSVMMAAQFDTGLRLGLMTLVNDLAGKVENGREEHSGRR